MEYMHLRTPTPEKPRKKTSTKGPPKCQGICKGALKIDGERSKYDTIKRRKTSQ